MHKGIKINPHMHTGTRKSLYAYGDLMDTNPHMHTEIRTNPICIQGYLSH